MACIGSGMAFAGGCDMFTSALDLDAGWAFFFYQEGEERRSSWALYPIRNRSGWRLFIQGEASSLSAKRRTVNSRDVGGMADNETAWQNARRCFWRAYRFSSAGACASGNCWLPVRRDIVTSIFAFWR